MKLVSEGGVASIPNVTPDSLHAPLSLQAIAEGKHILCEEPLATNHANPSSFSSLASSQCSFGRISSKRG
jgi:hypothetical protein